MSEGNSDNRTPEFTQQQMVDLITFQTIQALQSFAPDLDADTAAKLSQQAAYEQVVTIPAQIMPTLRGSGEERYPTYAVKVSREGRPDAVVKAPKDFKGVTDTGVAVQSASILSLIMTPVPRALLRARGYQVEFMQMAEAPKGRIIQ